MTTYSFDDWMNAPVAGEGWSEKQGEIIQDFAGSEYTL
jgi:hypothetical protein